MYIAANDQFVEARLDQLVRSAIGDSNAPNGTPLADVLIAALAVDIRRASNGNANSLLTLTDDQIFELGFRLNWALERSNTEFTLPLGAKVVSSDIGGVTIIDELWVLVAGRPGLHAIETVPQGASGPNLVALRDHIESMTRKLACRRIGLPTAHFVPGPDARSLIQFPAFAPAGGVVLQRHANGTKSPRFSSATDVQIREFAKEIVADMRTLWSHRKEIGARAVAVRQAAEAAAGKVLGATVDAVTVDLSFQRGDKDYAMYIEYNGINDTMRPGVILDYVPADRDVERDQLRAPYNLDRDDERVELVALGADGRIDDVARAIVDAAPEGAAAVLARLAVASDTLVAIPGGKVPLYATLFWHDGTICADITVAGALDYYSRTVELKNLVLPETIVIAMVGRPLSEVADLRFHCDAKVTEVSGLAGGVRLHLDVGTQLVDCVAGRMWPEPSAAATAAAL